MECYNSSMWPLFGWDWKLIAIVGLKKKINYSRDYSI